MNGDALIAASPNDRAYSARSNHSVAFAKMVNGYAELYDKWDSLTSDSRHKREEADRCDREAEKIFKQIESVAAAIREHMVGSGARTSAA